MRLLFTWITVFILIFVTVTVFWMFAPIGYEMLNYASSLSDRMPTVARDINEFNVDTNRYMYWVFCLACIFAYLVWGFLSSQQRDYDSDRGYYR